MEEENKSTWGGARAGAGRKRQHARKIVTWSLRAEDAELIRDTAKDLGISQPEVVHELVEAYKKMCEG